MNGLVMNLALYNDFSPFPVETALKKAFMDWSGGFHVYICLN